MTPKKTKAKEKTGEKLKSWKEIPEGGLIIVPASSEDFKTGDWKSFQPVWDSKKCIHCMFCVINCPDYAINVKNKKRIETDFTVCKGCGICAEVCPVKCITMKKSNEK